MQSQEINRTQIRTHASDVEFCAEDEMVLHNIKIVKDRYYFRCRIPADLSLYFRGKEISKALHTTDKKQARILASAWQQKINNTFSYLRLSSVHDDLKKEIIKSEIYPKTHLISSKKPLKLQALIDDYLLKKADSWREKTAHEVEASLRLIAEIIGDEPLHHIDLTHVQKVKNALQKLPANMRKNPLYKDKKVSEILKMPNVVPMSTTTANKQMSRLSSLFGYACSMRYIPANFAADQLIKIDGGRKRSKRKIYADEDISALYRCLTFDAKYPERYWIPILGLFCGFRLNEICQLYKKDVYIKDNAWVVSINADTEGKQLKNEISERIVPVPDFLVALGFAEYAKNCNTERLWPNLTLGRDGYGHLFSKWFQRLNRKHITDDKGKVFHSLRHNFINCLKQKGIDHSKIAALSGHKIDTMVNEIYGKNYDVWLLKDIINHIDFYSLPDIKSLGEPVNSRVMYRNGTYASQR